MAFQKYIFKNAPGLTRQQGTALCGHQPPPPPSCHVTRFGHCGRGLFSRGRHTGLPATGLNISGGPGLGWGVPPLPHHMGTTWSRIKPWPTPTFQSQSRAPLSGTEGEPRCVWQVPRLLHYAQFFNLEPIAPFMRLPRVPATPSLPHCRTRSWRQEVLRVVMQWRDTVARAEDESKGLKMWWFEMVVWPLSGLL